MAELMALGIVLTITGIFMIAVGLNSYLLRKKIENTPTSKVRGVAIGLAELFGKVRIKEETVGLVTKTKCAYHKITVEYYKSGKNSGWKDVLELETSNKFYLEDETGKITVDPVNAQKPFPYDFEYIGYVTDKGFLGFKREKLSEEALAFIEALPEEKKKKVKLYSGLKLRIREYLLRDGDALYVLGEVYPIEGATGVIGHENLVIRKGNGGVMYLSDSSEKQVHSKISKEVLANIGIGLIFLIIGIIILLGFKQ